MEVLINSVLPNVVYRKLQMGTSKKRFCSNKFFILILGLCIDIFAAISHLSLRQSSLQYIQYNGVAFPCARRDLAANIVYTPTED